MDDRRERIRSELSELYIPFYDALCKRLPEDAWAPYNGLRSFDTQAALYASGRSRPGRIITYAAPGSSPHNYGMATDWAPIQKGKLGWPNQSDALWTAYGLVVEGVGLRWGGRFNKFIDCPHNELVLKMSWGTLKGIFETQGLSGVEKHVRDLG